MGGGKPKTSAELELELKKELAGNYLFYFFFVIGGMLLIVGVMHLRSSYELFRIIPEKYLVLVFSPFLLWCVGALLSISLNKHILHCLNLGERDQVLKWFRWEMVAALLLFQPRAHALMKALLRRVEVEEEEERAAV